MAIKNISTFDKRRSKNPSKTEFLIAICHQIGDKWQSENCVSSDFLYHVRGLLRAFAIADYPVWFWSSAIFKDELAFCQP